MDADLRRPAIRDVSHIPGVTGLADGLRAKSEQKLSVFQITSHLSLLPAGRPDPDPMSGLTSSRMRRILSDAAHRFDWVVVDAPPVGTVSDASILAEMVDATLLVVRARHTDCELTQKAIEAIGRERILGVVLNAVDPVEDAGTRTTITRPRRLIRSSGVEGSVMQPLLAARLRLRTVALIAVEHLLIILAVASATIVRFGWTNSGLDWSDGILWRASLVGLVLQICLHYADLYDLRTLTDRRGLVVGLIQALGASSLILALLYYWIPSLIIGRGVIVIASVLIVGLVAGWRIAFEWLAVKVGPSERLLIVGTSDASVELARELFSRRQELGVELVGFVDPDARKVGTSLINPGIIGTVGEIPAIVQDRKVDRVVVSLADARGKLPMDALLHMKLTSGVQFDHLASVYEEYTGKIAVENLRPSWLIFSQGFRKTRLLAAGKRSVDILVSLAGLIVALPIMLVVAAAVRMTSSGPALYTQQRVGRNGRLFTIHKFRSMRADAEKGTGAVWSTAGDPRVTPVGRLLRRTPTRRTAAVVERASG